MKSKWPIKTLSDVCIKIQDGAHRSPQILYSTSGAGRFPYLTSKNIRMGFLKTDDIQYCDEEFHYEIYSRCNPEFGDVLLTKDGANTGNVTINTLNYPFSLLSSVCLLKPDIEKLAPSFLVYYIQSKEGFEQITGQMTGAAIKRIILKTIKASTIPLPPLPEQQRIVSILDDAFAAIDQAIANIEKNILNARELFDSYLNGVFMHKGEGWRESKLFDIGKIQTGSTPKTNEKDNFGDHIPFIKPADFFEDGQLNYNNEGLSEKGLKGSRLIVTGSVMMVCIGATIGKVGYNEQEVASNQQINSLTPVVGILPKFLYYQMRTKIFQQSVLDQAGQATLPIINKSKWSNLAVSYPTNTDEQQSIVLKLDSLQETTSRLRSQYQQKLTALQELKQSILQKAFSGELTADTIH